MMTEPFVFVVAAVCDLSAADSIVDTLNASARARVGVRPDVVSLGRKSSGDVRFHREGPHGARWNAAAALAGALFPSVAADQPGGRTVERVVLAAVSGRVATAIGRSGLRDFGELLDTASASVIVATTADHHEIVAESLPDSAVVMIRTGQLDVAELDRLAAIASRSLPPHRTVHGVTP